MQLYVDMDGVLTDFDGHVLRHFGQHPDKLGDELYKLLAQTPEFFATIPWMKDGKKLWNEVKKFKPTILTSPTNDLHCKKGKMAWISQHLGKYTPFILERDKFKYATPHSILIDDSEKKVVPFRQHGGRAILHKNTAQTLKELRNMMKIQSWVEKVNERYLIKS